MNILFLTSSCVDPTKGGVQKITYSLINPLRASGNLVYLLSWKRNGNVVDSEQYFLPDSSKISSAENIVYLHRLIKKNEINVIVNQQGISIAFIKLLANLSSSIKLISVMHNSLLTHIKNIYYIHEYKFENKGFQWLLRIMKSNFFNSIVQCIYYMQYTQKYSFIVKKSDNIVILSSKLENELAFFMSPQKYKSKLVIIPNFITDNGICDSIDNLLKHKEKRILYVGRIDFSMKRVDLLLKIWKKIQSKFLDWSLDIVGGTEKDVVLLSQIKEDMNLQRVYIEGFVEPQEFYKKASIYCMTSCAESFGMVLIEAMSYATVPIAFNSYPTITDIIDSDINGILIDDMNIDFYVNALSFLIEDKEKREFMAQNAIEKSRCFSEKKIIPMWNSILC